MVPEKRLRQLANLGSALADLAQGDLQTAKRDALFLKAVQEAREMTGAAYSSLGLVEGDVIHWLSADGKPLYEVQGRKQPVTEGLCGWVVRCGRSRRTGNVTGEADYYEQYAEMQSELDVPLKVGERVIGVLSMESPVARAFDVEHEHLMEVVAQFLAIALAASAS
jgi:putative methionine-R-sulfoxide reductase with GAF domain